MKLAYIVILMSVLNAFLIKAKILQILKNVYVITCFQMVLAQVNKKEGNEGYNFDFNFINRM